MPHPPSLDTLTERELDIARLIADGLSNHEIADKLVLTHGTVKWYCGQIYSKLGVSTRPQAIKQLQAFDLLDKSPTVVRRISPRLNLPTPLTAFVGREREIADVLRLLRSSRLLTLTGTGGTGKTRLALAVAGEAAGDFAAGISFVDLAPIADAGQVVKAIVHALGVIENANESALDTLKRALADQEHLLLIDNFEHVIEGAPVILQLLASAPRVKILATSREALRVSGEQEYSVPPLTLPAREVVFGEHLGQSEATTLFVQRVKMALPSFEISDDNAPPIAQICARLDGLPLAIELAAARCKLLSPQAMLARLDSRLHTLTGGSRDAPARQQTLRNTIEWSYNLLDEGEKILFARLAVFRGGRSLEAIEAICAEGLPVDVFDGLSSLVDKSLIQQKTAPDGEPRFVMLETLHEFAWERLEASGDAELIRKRHTYYFVELAERAEPELALEHQYRWFDLLATELDNIRTALAWSLESGEIEAGLRISGALFNFWLGYGYHIESQDWTQRLLLRMDEAPVTYHPKFLLTAAQMMLFSDAGQAENLFTQAIEMSRQLEDPLQLAWGLTLISQTIPEETVRVSAALEESVLIFQVHDHKQGLELVYNRMGEVARVSGQYDDAKRAYEKAVAIAEQIGDTRRIYVTYGNLAFVAQREGDHSRAIELLRQAITLCRDIKNKFDVAWGIQILAGSLGATGESERAVRLFSAAATVGERMGAFVELADRPEFERIIAAVRGTLDEATFQAAWAEGRKMTLDQAVADALGE